MDVIRPLQRPGTRRGPADWFTGEVLIDAISTGPHVRLLNVHFAPGARTAWHTHPFGQTIYVTEGAGLAQSRAGRSSRSAPATSCSSPPARTTGTAPARRP